MKALWWSVIRIQLASSGRMYRSSPVPQPKTRAAVASATTLARGTVKPHGTLVCRSHTRTPRDDVERVVAERCTASPEPPEATIPREHDERVRTRRSETQNGFYERRELPNIRGHIPGFPPLSFGEEGEGVGAGVSRIPPDSMGAGPGEERRRVDRLHAAGVLGARPNDKAQGWRAGARYRQHEQKRARPSIPCSAKLGGLVSNADPPF